MSNSLHFPATVLQICPAQSGPLWALGGVTCGCVLPANHKQLGEPNHRCDCGMGWDEVDLDEFEPEDECE